MLKRAWGLGWLLLLIASVASARPPVTPDSPGCQAWNGESADVDVRWGGPTRTPGCWFFSGPGSLGRDDHLGGRARWTRQGDRVSLAFGPVRFEGTIEGGRARLTRSSTHDSGAPWQVTETITLQARSENGCTIYAGRYHYDECQSGTRCPNTCHIDAVIRLARR